MRSFHVFFIRGITPSWCVSMTASTIFISFCLLTRAISSCVISPSEPVVIVGDRSSFSCNARPNNQERGSITFIKLGSNTSSETDIFRPPEYNRRGNVTKRQYLAEDYSLSYLQTNHADVTIQIKETQLKHGGQYFCSCFGSTSTLGTANFTVLDELTFARTGDKNLTQRTLVDVNCSVSFNGSTSSAFIDLTLSDANGTQVSAAKNLSLISNVTGHHVIHRNVVADPKEEQIFTCELKVWNKSSTGESLLRSVAYNLYLNLGHQTKSTNHSMKAESRTTCRTASMAVGVLAALVFLVVDWW